MQSCVSSSFHIVMLETNHLGDFNTSILYNCKPFHTSVCSATKLNCQLNTEIWNTNINFFILRILCHLKTNCLSHNHFWLLKPLHGRLVLKKQGLTDKTSQSFAIFNAFLFNRNKLIKISCKSISLFETTNFRFYPKTALFLPCLSEKQFPWFSRLLIQFEKEKNIHFPIQNIDNNFKNSRNKSITGVNHSRHRVMNKLYAVKKLVVLLWPAVVVDVLNIQQYGNTW